MDLYDITMHMSIIGCLAISILAVLNLMVVAILNSFVLIAPTVILMIIWAISFITFVTLDQLQVYSFSDIISGLSRKPKQLKNFKMPNWAQAIM